MRSRALLALAVVGCGCAASSTSPSTSYHPTCQEDERRVYAAWLGPLEAGRETVVLKETTSAPPRFCYPTEDSFRNWTWNGRAIRVHRSTLADFKWANRTRVAVQIDSAVPHEYICAEEARRLLGGEDRWKEFHQKHPHSHGFYTLSRVGFSRDGTEALLYVDEFDGPIDDGPRFLLFWKFDGHWELVAAN